MERGMCKLCLQEKMLCNSHLVPAGLYKYCAAKDLGPVRFTSKEISAGNPEVTAYLLCQRCENHLNREGENWLLPKLASIDKTFPFYDIVLKGIPDTTEGGAAAYACIRNPEIGFRKLTNFAIGVFWKASVHSWAIDKSGTLINLGSYQKQFRGFLIERKPFPQKAVLVVGVLPPEKAPIGFNLPALRGKVPYHQYVFYIPGILFALNVGNQVTEVDREIGILSNPLRPILVHDFSKDVLGLWRKTTKTAAVSPEVAEFMKRKRA